jgi:DivIVA domain-containing protein
MPLTPADVHNVIFKKPPIGKRGYDEDDVDAFLDEVERELARLIEENNDLRGGAGAAGATAGDGDLRRALAENNELKQHNARLRQEALRAEQAAQQAIQQAQQQGGASAPNLSGALTGETTGEQQALRVLMLAQRTADDHVADAHREADKVLTEARAKADELTRDARTKAEALERDARERHQQAMGGLDSKRNALQKHIEELKAFEREYRTRLKAFLESQLRDLEGRSQQLESEASARAAGAATGSDSRPPGSFGATFSLSDTSESRR